MSLNLKFDTTAEKGTERSVANARKGTKLIIILLGILSLVICSVFASMVFLKQNKMQHIIYADEVIVSTIENVTTTTTTTTTTSIATTTTTTNTTTLTTVTTTEVTATTTTTEPVEEYSTEEDFRLPGWEGDVLTSTNGRINGPSGQETYYNLPMDGIVSLMRSLGFDEKTYPHWIRSDGVKMLGDYVMCAANLELRPRGSLVESSLGMAIVCDTGGFAYSNHEQLDIATDWYI